jgi:hypothetical protein
VPLLVRPDPPQRGWRPAAWAFAVGALCIASSVGSPEFGETKRMLRARPVRAWALRVVDNAAVLVGGGCRSEMDAALASSREAFALPRVRDAVGADRLDLFGHSQGWVFLNGLPFALRPTIQTYSAYTAALQQLDADWYAGPEAPAWSLVDFTAIDLRWPAAEDALAFDALRAHYEPVLTERQMLLLRHRDGLSPRHVPPRALAVAGEAAFGEDVRVPATGDALHLTIEIEPTLWTRLRTAAWRAPILHFEVSIDGTWHRHRFIPLEDAPSFLLAPALRDAADLVDWARGADVPWPEAFRLTAGDGAEDGYAPTYRYRLESTRPDAFAGGPAPDLEPIPRSDVP